MMNVKWPLYLMASINKHFEANITTTPTFPVAFLCEGFSRTDIQNNAANLVELRYTGPFWTQLTPKTWRITIIINCALQTTINDKNNYNIWTLFGIVNNAFALPISIKTYGDVSLTEIGCLQIKTNKEDIVDNFLGQIDPSVKRVQGEVTAHYTIELEES